jgi:hypothetical protein
VVIAVIAALFTLASWHGERIEVDPGPGTMDRQS